MTDLERYKEACNYPGSLDEEAVERHLAEYLNALKVDRKIVRLRSGWSIYDHPSLKRNIDLTIDDLNRRNPNARDASDALAASDARDASDARAARDALAARAARDARDASDASDALAASAARAASFITSLQRFASWCIFARGWWSWDWDLSWLVTTYFGARRLKKRNVELWSRPLLDAFLAGCWFLYWTDDTLYWIAKPIVHRDPTPGVRRLHNDKYAALENDIDNLYFWRGVLVPAFVVVRPDWITIKHIDGETNAECRRVMIERYKHGSDVSGVAAYIRDAGGERLDHDERYGTLWRRNAPDDEPIVMIEVINSTREPTGHFKRYWLRVPPRMRTAHEAVAWTFGLEAREYAPEVET